MEGGVVVDVCTEEEAGCIAPAAEVDRGLLIESEVLPAAVTVSSVPNVLSPLTVLVSSPATGRAEDGAAGLVVEASLLAAVAGASGSAFDLAAVAVVVDVEAVAFFAALLLFAPFFVD